MFQRRQELGKEIDFLVQDGFAPASCLDLQSCQSLFLVAFEPGVDHNFAAAHLVCDLLRSARLGSIRISFFEQDHSAALAKLVRLALPPGFFQSGAFLIRQGKALNLCREPSLTHF